VPSDELAFPISDKSGHKAKRAKAKVYQNVIYVVYYAKRFVQDYYSVFCVIICNVYPKTVIASI
jgi:hypothetical protein